MKAHKKRPLLADGIILNGKWEILEHIATGGKGEVYRARQTNLDRDVVVKTVSVDYLAEFGDDREEVETEIKRFHREAMAMARVRHPHVVQVYDEDVAVITKDAAEIAVQYVVMEYIPGPTLRSTMPEEGFGTNEKEARTWIRDYFLPILEGIEPIHELGIVHRDIKPENVLLDGTRPKITDFGVAGGVRWPQLTRSHHVEGTISYMAPEQFMELGETYVRGDVYALGKILYEAICGKMVDAKTACPLKGVCLANPGPPFLKRLDGIIQRSTAEDKELRIPSVSAIRDELETLLRDADAAKRPLLQGLHRKQIAAIAGVLLFLVEGTNVYHHVLMGHGISSIWHFFVLKPLPASHSEEVGNEPPATAHRETPASTITGKDGSTMRLVSAGQVKRPYDVGGEAGSVAAVGPFYIDETEVTNLKYVEFLNQVLLRIQVANGMVHGDRQPWLLLGPVRKGYEPIVYRNGRFMLGDTRGAANAVVNVTGYGAAAYVHFYGKRLPTELDWLLATARDNAPAGHASDGPQIPFTITRPAPNEDGLQGIGAKVSEWGLRPETPADARPGYVIIGRTTAETGPVSVEGIAQDPSGSFADVGFRGVMAVDSQ